MPPRMRTPEEKQHDKQKIIDAALLIVQKHGLDGMTIRSLGNKLNMSSANIYNYFYNKDELYIHILITGFRLLQKEQAEKLQGVTDPIRRLEVFLRCGADFAMVHPAYYQLMFSTLDPKSMDYAGAPTEDLAKEEKQIAMETFNALVEHIRACDSSLSDHELRNCAIKTFCQLHGLLNLFHSNALREMDGEFDEILDSIINDILSRFRHDA